MKERPGHKYIVRIKSGNKYRYFYSKAEYQAFLRGGKKVTKDAKNVRKNVLKTKVSDTLKKVDKTQDKAADYLKKKTSKLAKKARKELKETEKKVDEVKNKLSKKFKKESEDTKKKVKEKAKDTKEKVDKKKKELDEYPKSVTPPKKELNRKANKDEFDEALSKKQLNDALDSPLSGSDATIRESLYWAGITNKEDASLKEIETALKPYMGKNETVSDALQRLGFIDETATGLHPSSYSNLKKKKNKTSENEDMSVVNMPNRSYTNESSYEDYGYTNNCAYCTLAYDMRRRGYDVEASAKCVNTGNTEEVIASWYKNGKFTHSTTNNLKTVEQEILKTNKNGSRGQFCVYWSTGGGHSISYEVKNNKVYVRDCQSNTVSELSKYPYASYVSECMYMRTDNLELTDSALVGVKNRY